MNVELALVLGLLALSVGMFVANRPRMDAVALIMLVVLPLTGVITMGEALAGFADPNIILIAALFVIGEGLVRTGVAQKVGDLLIAKAGTSSALVTVLLMLAVGALGSVMSSTGAVAIFIPIALRVAQQTGTAASRLMMPLSVAALISGMLTLVGTAPNLVVNSALEREGIEGFHFFSFTPFGLPILALGVVYMLFARKWLPERAEKRGNDGPLSDLPTYIGRYGLQGTGNRLRIPAGSPLDGHSFDEWQIPPGIEVIAIERHRKGRRQIFPPKTETQLEAGDLIVAYRSDPSLDVAAAVGPWSLEVLPIDKTYVSDRSQELGMAEAMISADSPFAGRPIIESGIRSRFNLTVLGLRHGMEIATGSLRTDKLRIGDTLLVTGRWSDIDKLRGRTHELILLDLPAEAGDVLPVQNRTWQALVCLLVMVGLMVSGVVDNVHAAFIACLLMGAFRCVDMDSAYRSIHWKSLLLIVGMLPFSIALQRTGGVEIAADALTSVTAGFGSFGVLASLFAITAMLGLFISNTATAVLMAPVALAMASEMEASPYPFAMIVALAASAAFMTPISSPVNTLVVGPGSYTFGDFIKIGVPFTLVTLVVSVLMVLWLLPM